MAVGGLPRPLQPDGPFHLVFPREPGTHVYYAWYMSLRRTNVYADAADLMIIKDAAARRGIPEAEIIREGIHLAAMSSRVWDDDPLDWPTFEGPGTPATRGEVTRTIAERLSEQ